LHTKNRKGRIISRGVAVQPFRSQLPTTPALPIPATAPHLCKPQPPTRWYPALPGTLTPQAHGAGYREYTGLPKMFLGRRRIQLPSAHSRWSGGTATSSSSHRLRAHGRRWHNSRGAALLQEVGKSATAMTKNGSAEAVVNPATPPAPADKSLPRCPPERVIR